MSIIIESLNHIYDIGSPYQTNALDNVSLKIETGDFVGLIGHTGSGKSTLIQHLNGILKPTSGKIIINNFDITAKGVKLNDVRKKVGLVFQYPEYQLFEETVALDIAFGPKNMGWEPEVVDRAVKEAMKMVGLDYEALKDVSPFELSGGQKRRVAIAGVLAMKPEVLILDEPTAGLDPKGRDEILNQLKALHETEHNTIILVSHSMEDVAKYVSQIYVMHDGKVVLEGKPQQGFQNTEELERIGLAAPQVTYVGKRLAALGKAPENDLYTVESAIEEILKLVRRKEND
jgi:energy-coupling factor transport system ATP-binding protein